MAWSKIACMFARPQALTDEVDPYHFGVYILGLPPAMRQSLNSFDKSILNFDMQRGLPNAQSPLSKAPPARDISRRLLTRSELPAWRNAECNRIERGYLEECASISECLGSCWHVHNETVNILSHVVGAVIFLAVPIVIRLKMNRRCMIATDADVTIFTTYSLCCGACFVLSAAFHTIISHSKKAHRLGIQFDYLGIIGLMFGAAISMAHFTFFDDQILRDLYRSLASTCAFISGAITLTPVFRRHAARRVRTFVFVCLGSCSLLPMIHRMAYHGLSIQNQRFPLKWAMLTTLLNTFGAAVYAMGFPECWWPRKFDIFGASHQLMHISVLLAAMTWLIGMVKAFDHVHDKGQVIAV